MIENFIHAITRLMDLGDNTYVREMWNGTWFTLTLAMIIALMSIAADRARLLRSPVEAYNDLAIQVCVAFSIFVAGSGLRAGYIWLLLHCQNFSGHCAWIIDDDWVMTLSGIVAIVGGLCTIRVLSPPRWRPWVWVMAAMFGVGVPLIYYGLGGPHAGG